MAVIKNRFKELLAKKERVENRKITRRDVAAETGISLSSIQAYANNTVQRYDADKLAILCDYFDCTISDLLIRENVDSPEMQTTPVGYLLTA